MEAININSLQDGMSFTGDLYIDNTFLLLPQSANIPENFIKTLKEWGFESFYTDGNVSLGGDIGISSNNTPKEEIKPVEHKLSASVLDVLKKSTMGTTEASHLEAVRNVYVEYSNYIEALFTRYATHKEINQDDLFDCIKELCIFVKDNKRYLLQILSSNEISDKNFLISHSLKTTILAICIALQLHTPLSKMIELGVTTILHEIGMLQIPPQLYMTDKKFSPGERAQITKHTVYGYTIIKNLNFPLPVQLGILEHHEKENGTGYPRHLTGDKISNYAKIIAVACSYEAISSPRKYKDERSTFEAIVEMLQNKNKQYDDAVVKALLYTVSLYPIGTYVYLSNRKVGVVIDTNPDTPKWPIVKLLTERTADGSPKTVQTSQEEIYILRILTRQEKEDILKIVEEKEKNIATAQSAGSGIKVEAVKGNSQETQSEQTTDVSETETQEKQPVQATATPSPAVSPKSSGGMEEIDIDSFN